MKEAFQSFPSGHSSHLFAGLGFLSLYLYGALKPLRPKTQTFAWRWFAILAPICAATFLSAFLTIDKHHHATDVVAGGVIGMVCAGEWTRENVHCGVEEAEMTHL